MSFVQQGKTSSLYGMPFYIEWCPTYHCNYHCSYCSQVDYRPKKADWPDPEKAMKIFDNLRKLDRNNYVISLAGGEPTIYPHLAQVMKHIGATYGNRLDRLYLITNGSKDIKLYEQIAALSDTIPFGIHLSVHTEHAVPDDLRYLIETIASRAELNFNLMFNPARRERTKELFELLLAMRHTYAFSLLIQTLRDVRKGDIIDQRYDREDFAWQKEAAEKFARVHAESPNKFTVRYFNVAQRANRYLENNNYIYERLNDLDAAMKSGKFDLKGNYCVMGTHNIVIEPDGRGANSHCRMKTYAKAPLYEQGPYDAGDFCKLVKCEAPACGCRGDDAQQKFAIREEAEDYLRTFLRSQQLARARLEEGGRNKEYIARRLELLARLSPSRLPLSEFVEQAYYYARYPDVAAAGIPAAEHYRLYGWKEGRNPAPWFDTNYYLSQFESSGELDDFNSDFNGMDPLSHYILRGVAEGKSPRQI